MRESGTFRMRIYWSVVVACGAALLIFDAPSWLALLAGLSLALASTTPRPSLLKPMTTYVLQVGVVALGAGMDLNAVVQCGLHGAVITAASVVFALVLGIGLGRWFGVTRDTGLLIAVGTAICGGSAIAAVSSVTKSKTHEVSIALAVVFVLNGIALLIFPPLGHAMHLSETVFGHWAALAIHDTSSVVGAGLAYGQTAVQVATTTKLTRALWIVPLTLGVAYYRQRSDREGLKNVNWPWFILGFVFVAALVTWVPALGPPAHYVVLLGRRLLVLALFLIGLSLSREQIKLVGVRPLLLGVVLWVLVGAASLPIAFLASQ